MGRVYMWLKSVLIIALCGGAEFFASAKSVELKSEKLPITFDDVIPNRFGQLGFGGVWISGNEFTFSSDAEGFVKFNVETNTTDSILSRDFITQHTSWTIPSFRLSSDLKKVLVRYASRQIFRHSTVAKFSIIRLDSLDEYKVADGDEIQIAFFTPNGKGLAFIRENDISYLDIPDDAANYGAPVKITDDGVPGIEYNGIPDWVYEEEVLSTDAAVWISPSGKHLAYARFNDTMVREAVYDIYGNNTYPEEVHLRYPKAGTTNPTVELFMVELDGSDNPSRMKLEPPVSIVSSDHILGTVFWINDEQVGAIWLNRRQDQAVLVSYDTTTPTASHPGRIVMEFGELERGWVDINTPKCDANSICYFINNHDNWPMLTSVDIKNQGTTKRLSPPGVNVLSVYGIRDDGEIFYLANPKDQPFNRHVYSSTECLSCNIMSPEGSLCLNAAASFSRDFSHYSLTCAGPDPSFTKLYRSSDNLEVLAYQMNSALRTRLTGYEVPRRVYFFVEVEGGFQAPVMMILPEGADFNYPNEASKKFPMLIRVYGGPGSVRVSSGFSIGFPTYQVSSKDIIYVEIDGRGTGQKGLDMMFSVNNRLGTYEMEDQIAVAKHLIDKFKFIDSSRVGIWGWSYGGYATAMTLAKDTEKVFKCGISVAPVTSWRFYDTIYTERFMGINSTSKNYMESDVSTDEHVKVLGQHDFLLIHGNADDNVHYQQSMVLARALEKADILFEQLSYPDEAHGISGTQRHLYHSMDRFWDKCFKPKE